MAGPDPAGGGGPAHPRQAVPGSAAAIRRPRPRTDSCPARRNLLRLSTNSPALIRHDVGQGTDTAVWEASSTTNLLRYWPALDGSAIFVDGTTGRAEDQHTLVMQPLIPGGRDPADCLAADGARAHSALLDGAAPRPTVDHSGRSIYRLVQPPPILRRLPMRSGCTACRAPARRLRSAAGAAAD